MVRALIRRTVRGSPALSPPSSRGQGQRNGEKQFAKALQFALGHNSPALIAELYFDNAAAREATLSSNEGKAAEADLPNFAQGIVSVYFGVGRELYPAADYTG